MRLSGLRLLKTLPDFSGREVEFVRRQAAICVAPRCIKGDDIETFRDFSRPDEYSRIFPSRFKAEKISSFHNAVLDQYPTLAVSRKIRAKWGRSKSFVSLERTLDSLAWAEVDPEKLAGSGQELLLSPPATIFALANIGRLAGGADIVDVGEMVGKSRPLRGKFVADYRRNVVESLDKLGFAEESGQLGRLSGLTFPDLAGKMAGKLLELFLRRVGSPELLQEGLVWLAKSFADPLNMARNMALYLEAQDNEDTFPKYKLARHLVTKSHIETLVTISAYSSLVPDLKPGPWILDEPNLLTVGIKHRMVGAMGFNEAETGSILGSHKTKRYSAEGINFMDPGYISEMGRRLAILRPNAATLGLFCPEDLFVAIVNWTSLLKSINEVHNHGHVLCVNVDSSRACRLEVSQSFSHINQKFLNHFLGSHLIMDNAELLARVPTCVLRENMIFLNEQGVTKERMSSAPQVLFHPNKVVKALYEKGHIDGLVAEPNDPEEATLGGHQNLSPEFLDEMLKVPETPKKGSKTTVDTCATQEYRASA